MYALFWRDDVHASRRYCIRGSTLLAVLDVLNASSLFRPAICTEMILCPDRPLFYPPVLAVLISWKSRAEAALQGPSVGRFKAFICPGCISLFQSDYWIGTTKYKKVKLELWNCDTSISGTFIGMFWLFLINLFSAVLWNTSKLPKIAVFPKL